MPSDREGVALALACGLLLAAACGEPERGSGPDGATPPIDARPGPEIRLVEREGRIRGEPRADRSVILAWSEAELARWARRVEDETLVVVSPPLDRVRGVGAIELDLAPGGADRLTLTPTLHGDLGAMLRRARQIELPLERVAPGQHIPLRVDVHETLAGNWMDTVREPELIRLELALRGATPESVRLSGLRLLDPDAIAAPFAARSAPAELAGRLHPSWWVREGARAELAIDVPAGAAELRWYAGARGAHPRPRIRVQGAGGAVVLDETPLDEAAKWQPRRASLAPFAGQRVRLTLANEGDGIALFGDPRIVAAGDATRPPDVLVVLIDALRADFVGALGGPEAAVTPTLDRLIEEGLSFPMALSHSSWTKPSVVTLLTALRPTTHRVGTRTLSDRLPATVPTLQGRFRSAGWRTGSFVGNPLGSTLSGLERGFSTALPPRSWHGRPALGRHPSGRQIRAAFLDWLDEEPDRPAFAYLQVMEVHPSGRRFVAGPRPPGTSDYVAGVEAADRDLGALLDALAERDRETLVVVLADHGDSFGAHGRAFRGHGTSLYQDQIHVPLVFWPRRLAPHTPTDAPVGLVDVAPTLLARFGLPPLEHADGAPLDARAGARTVRSALIRFPHAPDAPTQYALVDPALRKVLRIGDGEPLAFDLSRDPDEEGRPAPDDVRALARALDAHLAEAERAAADFDARHGAALPGAVGDAELERLRSLGYIE